MWVTSVSQASEENELDLTLHYEEVTEKHRNLANLSIFNPSETPSSYSSNQSNYPVNLLVLL